ncbi:SCO7613 C-terminal domain-containing membrane protein [Actinoplanes sp. NPDC051343]|uniref:SCO7613 C-terminal domain-containing membrane protein n=1 Tax=Actinoplanes sp. NPDC051343 TaxID=3363906 RepID=UPI0037AF5189
MTYPCPFCGAAATDATGCPSCGRGPDRLALEVVRLDGVIADLTARLNATRLAAQRLDGELKQAWVRRAAAAAEVRDAVAQARAVPVPGPAPRPVPPRADASPKWIQNSLFLLGGLLLAVAAIVFTAVAWAQFGVGGRAALLAAFTGAALAVPVPAVRRGLAATAETFAAIGLLLILLDGYAAWYVNLSGVILWSPWSYAALVCAVAASVALAFPRLTGPRFAAVLLAQPVLPLLTVPAHLPATGHAFVLAGVLALDLTVLVVTRGPLRIVAGSLAGVTLLPTGAFAIAGLLSAGNLGRAAAAGAALLLTAVLPLAALPVLRRRVGASSGPASVPAVVQAIFAALMVVEVAAVAVRMAVLVAPAHVFLADSLALLGVAILAATVRSVWLDRTAGRGVRIGAGVALAPFAVAAAAAAIGNAARTLETARPPLEATLTGVVPAADPRLLLALASLAAAVAVTVPPAWRRLTMLSAGTLAILAVPAALHLHWWTAPIVDLAGLAAALFLASRYATPAAPSSVTRRTTSSWGAPSSAASQAAPSSAASHSTASSATSGAAGPWASLDPAVSASSTDAPTSAVPSATSAYARPSAAAVYPATAASSPSAPGASARTVTYGSELTAALLLAAHGTAAAFGTPAVLAATLTALSALAAALAVLTRRGPRRLDLAGPGVFAGLLLLPAIAWSTTAALTPSPIWQSRIALTATLLPLLAYLFQGHPLGNLRPFALAAALIPIAIAPTWAPAAGDSTAIYAGVALLALATLAADRAAWLAALLPAAAFIIATAEPAARLLFEDPFATDWKQTPDVPPSAPIAFLLVTAAATLWTSAEKRHTRLVNSAPPRTGWGWSGARPQPRSDQGRTASKILDVAASFLALTVALALAAAHVPWPCLPAAELLLGLVGFLTVALRAPATPSTTATAPPAYPISSRTFLTLVSTLLTWAGLAATLPSRPTAIAALGAVLVAASMAGASGRTLPSRLIGWLTAVAASIGIVHDVLGLAGRSEAFPLLGVAALTLALSWLLHRYGRILESRAVEAAAHATALLALLLSLAGTRPAVVCFVWGAALAVRALRPDRRDAYLVAAAVAELAGWCRLLAVHHVGLVEAYSIPAAAVALLAGLTARRRRRELTSWVAYGPALAAGLLPSLAGIAGGDGQYLRRLLLGLAALAIFLAGARARLQAPVVAGGSALALVALHELAQVWDLVPRWIPLAAAGLLLVVLAATLERRRRDFDRMRAVLTRMT